MSDDIVTRLRDEGFITHMARLPRESKVLHEAADEIERLRVKLVAAESNLIASEKANKAFALRLGQTEATVRNQFQEIDRLRVAPPSVRSTIARIGEILATAEPKPMPSDNELADMLSELAESYDSICEGEKATLLDQAAHRIRDQHGMIAKLRAEVLTLTEQIARIHLGNESQREAL